MKGFTPVFKVRLQWDQEKFIAKLPAPEWE